MWPSTYFGIPAFPFAINMLFGEDFAKSWAVRSKSGAPVPQFAPKAIGLFGIEEINSTIAAGLVPIIVRPAVSTLKVPTQGISIYEKAAAAALNSSGADIVSNQRRQRHPL